MSSLRIALACLVVTILGAQDVSKLPAWARESAALAQKETPPPDSGAWVILHRQEYAYEGKGEIRRRSFRLVKVLDSRGLAEGNSIFDISGGKLHELKSLKGWNLRPDGELVKLDKDDMVTLDPDRSGESTTHTWKATGLARVVLGSLVAFEFEERFTPITGLHLWAWPMAAQPVRRWEVACPPGPGGVDAKCLASRWKEWGLEPEPLPGGGLAANRIPPWPAKELGAPPYERIAPRVDITYLDSSLKGVPTLASWDDYARWCFSLFQPAMVPSGQIAASGLKPAAALGKILEWMNRQLIYQMVYLSPDRGWVPLACPEVVRRRNGDCKDHAACLLGEAKGAGLEGYPVLCSIGPGWADAGMAPSAVFNHAIAAIKLDGSLGLPAEVTTRLGRFLLVDSTSRYCPFGKLPNGHRGRQVLICTPQGGVWAEVPDAATEVPELQVDLEGRVNETEGARARIRVRETGNAHGLRAGALEGGEAHLRDKALRAWLNLPATGVISDLVLGNPLDLNTPFEVSFTASRPDGFSLSNGKIHLDRWGMPGLLPPIQKVGTPRQLPVEIKERWCLHYHAVWTFPTSARPMLPAMNNHTPFLDLAFKAGAQGSTVSVDLDVNYKDAEFGWDRREEGVTAWRGFRSLMNRLGEDGLLFRTE